MLENNQIWNPYDKLKAVAIFVCIYHSEYRATVDSNNIITILPGTESWYTAALYDNWANLFVVIGTIIQKLS